MRIEPSGKAKTFRWTGNGIKKAGKTPIAGSKLKASYPARSMTLFIVPT